MSLGATRVYIKAGTDCISSIDRDTLEYQTDPQDAMTFEVKEGGLLTSALRKKYPDTTFEVVPE